MCRNGFSYFVARFCSKQNAEGDHAAGFKAASEAWKSLSSKKKLHYGNKAAKVSLYSYINISGMLSVVIVKSVRYVGNCDLTVMNIVFPLLLEINLQ
jgi:hypothetical protein